MQAVESVRNNYVCLKMIVYMALYNDVNVKQNSAQSMGITFLQ